MNAPAKKRPGRPPVAPEKRAATLKPARSIRLGAEHWAKLQALGGARWIVQQLDRA